MAPLFDSEGLTAFHEMAILTLIWVGVGGGITTPRQVGFPKKLKNGKSCSPGIFATFGNVLLEKFVPNSVFLTRPSLQILGKTQTGVFPIFGFLVNPL